MPSNAVNRNPLELLFQMFSPNTVTQTDIINAKIRYYAPTGKPQQDFLESEIKSWKDSAEYRYLETAEKYYQNQNDINDRIRYTFNGKGNKVKSKLSNTKRSHAFFRDLVDQRVRYLLTKPFSLKTEDSAEGDAYQNALEPYFDAEFRRRFKNLGKQSTIDGLAWIQVAYSSTGKLIFTRIPRKEVIPFWADADHTILDAVIRFYEVVVYNGKEDETITKVQFHTREGAWYYQIDKNGFHEDTDEEDTFQPHFYSTPIDEDGNALLEEDGTEVKVGMTWDRIPFIAFKASSDELSLLKLVKSLIDDYDTNSSDLSNLLKDQPESIKIVKNYDGTDTTEFLQKLADYRTAFVREDGDISTINDPIDVSGVYQDLTEVRKNIYNFGSGVDYSVQNFGNATGVGLKFLYGKLAAAADDMADEFQAAFSQLCWFIQQDIIMKGGQDFSNQKAELIFNTDMIINETETIQNVIASKNVISDKTAVSNHPWVTDVEEELKAVEAQNKAEMQALIDKYGLPNPEDDEIDEEDE